LPFFGLFSRLDQGLRRALQSYWDAPGAGGFGTAALNLLLTPASWVYGVAQRMRRWCYRRGILTQRRLPCPVISVGALRVGGSGKTPFVLWLAQGLVQRGYRVAVLTRGYRGRGKAGTQLLLGANLTPRSPEQAGDEPCLLARALPGVPVAVNRWRYAGGLAVVRSFPVDIFLMDDGFQHLPLARDVDVVLIGGQDPDRLFCLPRGPLREPASALADASMIVRLSRGGADAAVGVGPRAQDSCGGIAPCCRARLEAGQLYSLEGRESLAPSRVRGKRIFAFCGIARETSFWRLLEANGLRPEERLAFPDHHRYSRGDCEALLGRLSSFDLAVTTEKDAVKVAHFAWPEGKVFFLRVALQLEDEERFWGQPAIAGVLGRIATQRRLSPAAEASHA